MPAWLLTMLPFLLKIPKYAKMLYKSKHFGQLALGGAMLGATGVGELGRAGERKMTKEQFGLQELLQEASAEANKKMTEESRANTEKYIKELAKVQEAEAKKAQEDALMQAFMESQNRQMATTLAAVQGTSMGPGQNARPGVGTFGLMRQGF